MTTAHATQNSLAAYANGSLSAGMSLLVASHLTYCPGCRRKVEDFEALDATLFTLSEADAGVPDLEHALARLDAADSEESAEAALPYDAETPLPLPLRHKLGRECSSIRWQFLLPGLSRFRLGGFGDEDVSLILGRPGVRIPTHTHSGEEATLVLAGQLRDGDRIFECGDISLSDESHNHRPEIVGEETCICLAVLSGRMHFLGPIGSVLNLFNR